MKNFKLVLLFGGTMILLILLIPLTAMCQDAVQAASTGLFAKVKDWIQSNAVEMLVIFVSGIAAKHGWTQMIKSIAAKGSVITKEVSEFFADGSTFLNILDQSIADDGTIKQNSVQEILNAGKEVIAEGKDVIISIKPKI